MKNSLKTNSNQNEESEESPKLKWSPIKKVITMSGPLVPKYGVVLLLIAMRQSINAILPLLLATAVTAVTVSDLHKLTTTCLMWIGLAFTGVFIVWVREVYELKFVDYVLPRRLSEIVLNKYYSISPGEHNSSHTFLKIEVVRKGKTAVGNVINLLIYDIAPTILTILFPLIMLCIFTPRSALLFITLMLIGVSVFARMTERFFPQIRSLHKSNEMAGKKESEMMGAGELIIHRSAQAYSIQMHDKVLEGIHVEGNKLWQPYTRFFNGGIAYMMLSAGVTIFYTGYLCIKDGLPKEIFVSSIMWVTHISAVIGSLSRFHRDLIRNIPPLERFFSFLEYEPVIKNGTVKVPGDGDFEITFKDVSYAHPDRKDQGVFGFADEKLVGDGDVKHALTNVSFTFKKGRTYALVGSSGAGKSTLLGLTLRDFDPVSGAIFVNDHNLTDLDLITYRRAIGYVPQENTLLDDTLYNNIVFGCEDIPKSELDVMVAKAVTLSGLEAFVSKCKDGLETLVGERGVKLSGGERQRLGIARAIVNNPRILIFDEATSSLDMQTEKLIKQSIDRVSKGRTTIIVAHRLATVVDADVIVVMDNGRIIDHGSHSELLNTCEFYRSIVKSQSML